MEYGGESGSVSDSPLSQSRLGDSIRMMTPIGMLSQSALTALRQAGRSLARRPRFGVSIVGTLAIGVGACGAVGLVASHILVDPLSGVRDPRRLVQVRMEDTRHARFDASPALLDALSESPVTEGVIGSTSRTFQVFASGEAHAVRGAFVSPGYFRVLGVRILQGRAPTEPELDPSRDSRVVLVSARLWRSRFASDIGVLGQQVTINGVACVVIGVVDGRFGGLDRLRPEDLWVPLGSYAALTHRSPTPMSSQSALHPVVARLRAGVNRNSAQHGLRDRFSEAMSAGLVVRSTYLPTIAGAAGLDAPSRARISKTIATLAVVVAFVLFASLANAANLLLLRAVMNGRDLGLRAALGASRSRLIVEHLFELCLIGLASGAAGAAIAVVFARLIAVGRISGLPVLEGFTIDPTAVLGLILGTTLVIPVLGAPAVALAIRNVSVIPRAKLSRFGKANELPEGLCIVQIGVSLALTVGAVLLSQTILGLSGVRLGFDPTDVRSYLISVYQRGYSADKQGELQRHLLRLLTVAPSVRHAAVSSSAPLTGHEMSRTLGLPGTAADQRVEGALMEISSAYFETVGTRVIAGRGFVSSDFVDSVGEAGRSIIVSQEMARRLFGTRNAIGRTVVLGSDDSEPRTIVGVAENIRMRDLRGSTEPSIFVPLGAKLSETLEFVVLIRSSASRATSDSIVRRAVRQFDPLVPIASVSSLRDLVREQFAEDRMLLLLLASLAASVALLAALGVHSVLSHSVASRSREFAIRIALGSRPGQIGGLIIRRSSVVALAGLTVGLLSSTLMVSGLRSHLYGVRQGDPLSYACATLLIALTIVAASIPPVLRALGNDPLQALRSE